MPSFILGTDPLFTVMEVNDAYLKITAVPEEQLIGRSLFDLISADAGGRGGRTDNLRKSLEEVVAKKKSRKLYNQNLEIRKKGKDRFRERFWTLEQIPILNESRDVEFILYTFFDVTDHQEKETLLAEIHHRVKNNLAVVSGMMQLQASEVDNREVTEKLLDSVVRIKTMANIHEQLYLSNSFSKLEFSENIKNLVSNILSTFQSRIHIDLDFDCESIQLNINQAIPCSLIINEVITNILKHAFPGRRSGEIQITLKRLRENSQIRLTVEDDGTGLPGDFDSRSSKTLGLTLIDVLSNQLQANYSFMNTRRGARFTLQFKEADIRGSASRLL